MEITEEQRKRSELNWLAALAKWKQLANTSASDPGPWKLFKCRKFSPERNDSTFAQLLQKPFCIDPQIPTQLPDKFRVRLEICLIRSPSRVFPFPEKSLVLTNQGIASQILCHRTTHRTLVVGRAVFTNLRDYDDVLKISKGTEYEEIPWATLNVVNKFPNSFTLGSWIPCRPEHLSVEKVGELIQTLPKSLVDALLPFQLEGVRFGLQRGGRCLIADEMGLGKTLQIRRLKEHVLLPLAPNVGKL